MAEPASVAGIEAQTKRFSEAADRIRGRADNTAKGLAAVGTSAVGALGVVKFADVFPIELDMLPVAVVVAMFLGLLLMIGAVLWLAAQQWRITRPVFTRSRPSLMKDLDDEERELVREVYQEHALLNGAPSLVAYEARGVRYQRIADRMDSLDARKAGVEARAAVIASEVRAKQARAAALVIRQRAARGVTGWKAATPVAVFVAGLAMIAVGADYLEGQRGRPAAATECAAAVKGLTEAGLEPEAYVAGACPLPTPTTPPAGEPPTVAATKAATLTNLAAQYEDCVEVAKDKPAPACEELRALIDEVASTPPTG